MMLKESYINDEAAFLEKIADKLNLKDKTRCVFIERFKINNDDLNNSALADTNVLSSNLSENTLRDSLRRIFKKLEDEGCHFNGATRDKVDIAKQWLREIIYPWQILKNIAVLLIAE